MCRVTLVKTTQLYTNITQASHKHDSTNNHARIITKRRHHKTLESSMLQQLEPDHDLHDPLDPRDPRDPCDPRDPPSPNRQLETYPKQLDKQLEKQLKHQLWSAAQRNDCDRVKSVLGVANIDITRALFVAAANDHHECVTAFVAAILSEKSSWRWMHVHYYLLHDALARAAFAGALRAMRVLVEAGAYQYGQRQRFGAELHPYVWAAQGKQTRAMQLLLDAKTDVNRVVSVNKPVETERTPVDPLMSTLKTGLCFTLWLQLWRLSVAGPASSSSRTPKQT